MQKNSQFMYNLQNATKIEFAEIKIELINKLLHER